MNLTHAVGIRTYQIFVTRKGKTDFVDPDEKSLTKKLADFLTDFIVQNSAGVHIQAEEKSWSIEQTSSQGRGESRGQISYGRYGYAASLRDVNTGKENYRRKRTDSEVLNLYYRFWLPPDERFIIAAFESFSGKSCISLVFEHMKEAFEALNNGFLLKMRRLMPAGATAHMYAGKPVKNLKLTTRSPSNDLADRLFRGKSQKTKRMTVEIFAGRNSILGNFSDLVEGLPADASGILQYDGVEFEKAVATVMIGGKPQTVGVFGANSETGVIDVTENVLKDADGIPTYESVDREATLIMGAIYETLNGQRE